MSLRTGIDLVEIERVEEAVRIYGERFLRRVYTLRELSDTGGNTASLAARFAAKEAAAKALGTGVGEVCWQDLEILRGPACEPELHLHGRAAELARELGLAEWSVSLSHTGKMAAAVVVAIG